jgi:hypothetical protein
VCVTSHPVTVTLPNGHRINSTHVGELRIAGLGPSARTTVHLFRNTDLAHYPLLSISQICDSDSLEVIYNANSVCVRTIDKQCIQMVGSCHRSNGLFLIDVSHPTQPPFTTWNDINLFTASNLAATVIHNESHAQLTDFYSATMGSPTTSTFLTAMEKSFVQFPGLTANILRRNRPDAIATPKGHLHCTWQGLRPTAARFLEDPSDLFPAADPPPTCRTATDPSRAVYVRFTRPTMENHADLAGRFLKDC